MSNAGGTDSLNNEDVEIEIEEGRLVCVHPNCAKKKHDYSLLTIQEHVAQHVLTDAPEREVSKKHFNLQCSSCSPAIHFVSFQHAYDHHMRLPSHRITPTNNVDWESRVEDKSVVESFRRYQDYQKLYIRVSHTKKSKFKLHGAPMPVSRGSAQSHVNVDTPGVAPKTGNRTRQEAVDGGPMGDVPATANMNHIRSGQPQQERVTRAAKTVQDGSDTRQAGVGTVASGASTTPNSSEKRRFKVVDIDTPEVETKRRTTRTIRDSSRMGGLMMDEDELRAAARAETSCRSPNPFGARSPCEWGGGNRTPGDVRTPTYSYSSAPWVDGSRPDRSRSPAYGGNRTPDRRQEYSFGPRQPRTPVYGEEEATLNKRDNNWSHAPPPPPRPAGTGLYGTASNMANDSSTMRGNGQEPSRQDHVQVKKDAGFSSGADCPGTSSGQARQTTSRLPSFAQAKRAPPRRDQVQQQPTTATTSGWAGFGLPTSTAAASSAARSSHGGPVFAQTPVAAAPVAVPPPPPQLPTPARARSLANTEVVSKASKHERRKTQMVENYMPRKPTEQPKPPPLRSPAAHRSRTPVPRGRSPARSRSPPARDSRRDDKKKRRRTPSSSEESEHNRRSRRSRRR